MNAQRFQSIFYLGLLLGAFYLSFLLFRPYLSALFIAFVLYIVWKPVHVRITSFFGKHVSIASAVSLIFAVLTVLVPIAVFGVLLSEDAANLYNDLVVERTPTESFSEIFDSLSSRGPEIFQYLGVDLSGFAARGLGKIVENADQILAGLFNFSLGTFVLLIALFYLFRDGDRFQRALFSLSPLPNAYDKDIVDKVEHAVDSVVKGSLLIAFAQGFAASIGFVVFGVPNAVLWGAVVSITSIIPSIGASIVLVPVIIYMYFHASLGATLGLIVWSAIVVGLIDNFLRMFVIKTGVPIHPFVILMSVIGGVGLFGAVGIIAGPVLVSFAYALIHLYPKFING